MKAIRLIKSGSLLEEQENAELLNRETEIIGVSDHLASELPLLLDLARTQTLDLSHVVTRTVSLDAGAINGVLDRLEKFGDDVRVVITP